MNVRDGDGLTATIFRYYGGNGFPESGSRRIRTISLKSFQGAAFRRIFIEKSFKVF